jgi:hypothetical protein
MARKRNSTEKQSVFGPLATARKPKFRSVCQNLQNRLQGKVHCQACGKTCKRRFSYDARVGDVSSGEARKRLVELPGIGDYSADIINPQRGFRIDVWSAEVFVMLFFCKAPVNNRQAVEEVKREGILRWVKWSWMAFFFIVRDLENLSKKIGCKA